MRQAMRFNALPRCSARAGPRRGGPRLDGHERPRCR